MHKTYKTILKVSASILIILIVGVFSAQIFLQNKIEQFLEKRLPNSVKLEYTDVDLSLIKNSFKIHNVEFTRVGETTNSPNLAANFKTLSIHGFGYWKYLFNNNILIDKVEISNPEITYYHNKNIPKEEYSKSQLTQFNKDINVSQFFLKDGIVKLYDVENDSLMSEVNKLNVSFSEIIYNSKTQHNKIPFLADSYNINFDNLFFKLNEFENITAEKSNLSPNQSIVRKLKLKTRYSKSELSRIIAVERDHYNLEIDSLQLNDTNVGYKQDSIFYIEIPKTLFYKPDFRAYRDKLVTDNETIKPLYGKMLRDLKFDLTLDTVQIENGFIQYAEKVRADRAAGEIAFSNFNATIENLANTYSKPTETILHINTQFMEHAPLQVTWKFDVNNKRDEFLFKAELGELKAKQMNTFTEPNLNKRLEGNLDKTYFTIFGNSEKSQIDFKVKYKHFDVVALKNNGQEKNKFLTDVFNLFVSKNSRKGTDDYIEVTHKDIERNKTKSVFNYIWKNTRVALIKAMTLE